MKPSHHPSPLTHHAPVPQELARRGITGARHEMPAGMEVNCAQDLVLMFGAEVRARLEEKAGFRPQDTGTAPLIAGKPAEVLLCATPSNPPSI